MATIAHGGSPLTPTTNHPKPVTKHRSWMIRLALALWVLAFLARNYSAFFASELESIDYMTQLRNPRSLGKDKIIEVDIDDKSYALDFKEDQPLDPQKIIQGLKVVAAGRPSVIAVDVETAKEAYYKLATRFRLLYRLFGRLDSG